MVKFEETNDRRRLTIGSFFVDLNESDYRELVRIFSASYSDEEIEDLVKELDTKDHDGFFIYIHPMRVGFRNGIRAALDHINSLSNRSQENN